MIFSFSVDVMKNVKLLEQMNFQREALTSFLKIASQIEQLMVGSQVLEEHFIKSFCILMVGMYSVYELKSNKIYEELISYFVEKTIKITSVLLESKHSLRLALQVNPQFLHKLALSQIARSTGNLPYLHHSSSFYQSLL